MLVSRDATFNKTAVVSEQEDPPKAEDPHQQGVPDRKQEVGSWNAAGGAAEEEDPVEVGEEEKEGEKSLVWMSRKEQRKDVNSW